MAGALQAFISCIKFIILYIDHEYEIRLKQLMINITNKLMFEYILK